MKKVKVLKMYCIRYFYDKNKIKQVNKNYQEILIYILWTNKEYKVKDKRERKRKKKRFYTFRKFGLMITDERI